MPSFVLSANTSPLLPFDDVREVTAAAGEVAALTALLTTTSRKGVPLNHRGEVALRGVRREQLRVVRLSYANPFELVLDAAFWEALKNPVEVAANGSTFVATVVAAILGGPAVVRAGRRERREAAAEERAKNQSRWDAEERAEAKLVARLEKLNRDTPNGEGRFHAKETFASELRGKFDLPDEYPIPTTDGTWLALLDLLLPLQKTETDVMVLSRQLCELATSQRTARGIVVARAINMRAQLVGDDRRPIFLTNEGTL